MVFAINVTGMNCGSSKCFVLHLVYRHRLIERTLCRVLASSPAVFRVFGMYTKCDGCKMGMSDEFDMLFAGLWSELIHHQVISLARLVNIRLSLFLDITNCRLHSLCINNYFYHVFWIARMCSELHIFVQFPGFIFKFIASGVHEFPGARSSGRLNFVRWLLMFVDLEYGACFMPVAILGHRILMWPLYIWKIYAPLCRWVIKYTQCL
jgi:hypothetical protein